MRARFRNTASVPTSATAPCCLYAPLRDAARARQRADWLVGMNATRAMTIMGRSIGKGSGVLSLGRVQTPTLALVVRRDQEIAHFIPSDYFVLRASLAHASGEFAVTFLPDEAQAGLDSNGRLTDAAVAFDIAERVQGTAGLITEATRETKTKAAPLPHSLSSLQKEASAKFSISAKQVLDTAQSLYEKKLTTYPRSDCRYLPEEQFEAAGSILASLAGIPGIGKAAGGADPTLKSPAWNTQKVTAHHAIIPTGEKTAVNLTENERALFGLIVSAYCLQFYPPMRYEARKIGVTLGDTRWEARGRHILDAGWTAVAADDDDAPDQPLPTLEQGDPVQCRSVEAAKKKTSPPARFTEGTLIEAMAHIHRFVEDATAKSVLKENEGIGTEATRAKILETLKARGYLTTDKKALVSTPLGRDIISLTPDALKNPITTAQWKSRLDAIAQGKETLEAFMSDQVRILPELLAPLLEQCQAAHVCPDCGAALYRRKGKKPGTYFWACSGYPSCKTTMPDNNGQPGIARPKPQLSSHVCPDCGKPLAQRQGAKGPFFGCSGYPVCKRTFPVGADGSPDFTAKNGKG